MNFWAKLKAARGSAIIAQIEKLEAAVADSGRQAAHAFQDGSARGHLDADRDAEKLRTRVKELEEENARLSKEAASWEFYSYDEAKVSEDLQEKLTQTLQRLQEVQESLSARLGQRREACADLEERLTRQEAIHKEIEARLSALEARHPLTEQEKDFLDRLGFTEGASTPESVLANRVFQLETCLQAVTDELESLVKETIERNTEWEQGAEIVPSHEGLDDALDLVQQARTLLVPVAKLNAAEER